MQNKNNLLKNVGQWPQRSKLRQEQKQVIIEGAQLSAFPFPPRDLLTLGVDREPEMPWQHGEENNS